MVRRLSKSDHGKFNPHLWFSLDLMPKFAETIKNKMVEVYPDKKDVFEKNYTAFLEELNALQFRFGDIVPKKHFEIDEVLKDTGLSSLQSEFDITKSNLENSLIDALTTKYNELTKNTVENIVAVRLKDEINQ